MYNLTQSRIRIANFPYKKYLQDILIKYLPCDAQLKLENLSILKFDSENLILYGNFQTGKTNITIVLDIKACLEGFNVLFTTASSFITQLKKLKSTKNLRSYQNKLSKYDLVILDEFGFISSDNKEA